MSKLLPVMEIFGPTLQGEGPAMGQPVCFIRLAYCDYRCHWCDSLHAVDPDRIQTEGMRQVMTVEQILEQLASRMERNGIVVISGGNPALHDLAELIYAMHLQDWQVHLETQGSLYQDWMPMVDVLIVSPKPPSSGMAQALSAEVLIKIKTEVPEVHWKIVVFDKVDVLWAQQLYYSLLMNELYLSVGTEPGDMSSTILSRMKYIFGILQELPVTRPRFNWRLYPQMHVLLWGHKLGV